MNWKDEIKVELLSTLVNENAGNETPTKNPKTDPTNIATKILIISFGFLEIMLQENKKTLSYLDWLFSKLPEKALL